MDAASIQKILVYVLPVLFAITLHEAAHGYVARHFGDMTATAAGRVTLNPIPHIDPLGTIAIPLLLYFATSGQFLFGYARPVPVDFSRLRNPKRDMIWVALAGPLSNLLQAFLWGVLLMLLLGLAVPEPFFVDMARAGILVNLVMWAFNLFPLPPLDGGRVLVGVLPIKPALALASVERWGFFIVLALVLLNVIGPYWLRPLMWLGYVVVGAALQPLAWLFS